MASVRVELMSMEIWWNYMDTGKTSLSATSSTTNPTRTGLELNNDLHVNGRLILGTTSFLTAIRNEGQRRVFQCWIIYYDMNSCGGVEEYLYAF
jgi:hypothetical protein